LIPLVEIDHQTVFLSELEFLGSSGTSFGTRFARRRTSSKHWQELSILGLVGVATSGSKVVGVLLAVFAVDLGYRRIENLKQ
jgi:hypothetical protein